MPVFSSGQTVRQAADTFAAIGTVDLVHAAGGGTMAHPGGIEAGVAALRQAWEAAVAGVPVEDCARAPRVQAGFGQVRGLNASWPEEEVRQPEHERRDESD